MSDKRKPRIMFLIRDMERGGAQRVVVNTLRKLCEYPLDLYLGIVCTNDYSMLVHLKDTPVHIVKFGKQSRYDLGAWVRMVGFLRRERIDVLHIHGFNASVWGVPAALFAGTPVVIRHIHTNLLPKAHILLQKALSFRVDEYVSIGESNRQIVIDKWGIPENKIRLIHNAVDTDELRPPEGPMGERFGFPENCLVVGSAGRLSREKGYDVLIDAAKIVVEKDPDVRFIIAGIGPLKQDLEHKIHSLHLDDKFLLPGSRDDMPEFYRSLDLFAMSSRYEGLPMCLLEAMSSGRPCVVTDIGGCRDLVENGKEGLIVPPENAGALAAAVLNLLADPQKRKSFSTAARNRVMRVASLDVVVQEHLRMYRRLLESKKANVDLGFVP